jgi:hypothetical protein
MSLPQIKALVAQLSLFKTVCAAQKAQIKNLEAQICKVAEVPRPETCCTTPTQPPKPSKRRNLKVTPQTIAKCAKQYVGEDSELFELLDRYDPETQGALLSRYVSRHKLPGFRALEEKPSSLRHKRSIYNTNMLPGFVKHLLAFPGVAGETGRLNQLVLGLLARRDLFPRPALLADLCAKFSVVEEAVVDRDLAALFGDVRAAVRCQYQLLLSREKMDQLSRIYTQKWDVLEGEWKPRRVAGRPVPRLPGRFLREKEVAKIKEESGVDLHVGPGGAVHANFRLLFEKQLRDILEDSERKARMDWSIKVFGHVFFMFQGYLSLHKRTLTLAHRQRCVPSLQITEDDELRWSLAALHKVQPAFLAICLF